MAAFLRRADDFEGGEAFDPEGGAEGLVDVCVAVDGGDFDEAVKGAGGFFVGGFEVLAVAAPGGVELDDLEMLVEGSKRDKGTQGKGVGEGRTEV